jgi:hypothetical protein
MRLGRLATAALSLGLIAVAAVALWDGARGALSLVGLVVAFTPSVLAFATALNERRRGRRRHLPGGDPHQARP